MLLRRAALGAGVGRRCVDRIPRARTLAAAAPGDADALRAAVAGAAGPLLDTVLADGPAADAAFEPTALARVSVALGHDFGARTWLLRAALTHRSFRAETFRSRCSEALAWVGDAVIHHALTPALLSAYPAAPVGDLTAVRAHLVSRAALAALARDAGVADALATGKSFAGGAAGAAGGPSVAMRGEAAEAVLGAVFADAGAEAAEAAYWRLRGPLPPTLGALQSQVAAAVQ